MAVRINVYHVFVWSVLGGKHEILVSKVKKKKNVEYLKIILKYFENENVHNT